MVVHSCKDRYRKRIYGRRRGTGPKAKSFGVGKKDTRQLVGRRECDMDMATTAMEPPETAPTREDERGKLYRKGWPHDTNHVLRRQIQTAHKGCKNQKKPE